MNNRIMVYFLAVFTFLGSVNLFSQSAQDTSFTATMKFDGNKHKINVKFFLHSNVTQSILASRKRAF